MVQGQEDAIHRPPLDHTDHIEAACRGKSTSPAAELQQNFPTYEVGGDWFDFVENRDGAWLAARAPASWAPAIRAMRGGNCRRTAAVDSGERGKRGAPAAISAVT
jgi:hypothetical protein